MEQLLLFPETPVERVQREVKMLREQSEKVRKSQYAKIGAIAKQCDETIHELKTLKEAICFMASKNQI
jgi:hypothetical protein